MNEESSKKHVGRHMLAISLFSLPMELRTDEDESDESQEDQGPDNPGRNELGGPAESSVEAASYTPRDGSEQMQHVTQRAESTKRSRSDSPPEPVHRQPRSEAGDLLSEGLTRHTLSSDRKEQGKWYCKYCGWGPYNPETDQGCPKCGRYRPTIE